MSLLRYLVCVALAWRHPLAGQSNVRRLRDCILSDARRQSAWGPGLGCRSCWAAEEAGYNYTLYGRANAICNRAW